MKKPNQHKELNRKHMKTIKQSTQTKQHKHVERKQFHLVNCKSMLKASTPIIVPNQTILSSTASNLQNQAKNSDFPVIPCPAGESARIRLHIAN